MADELIDIIDENGRELGITKMKSEAHRDGDWHKAAHLWIVVGDKVMMQKRSASKEFFPERFDVGCAGHVDAGESYEQALLREVEEELGVTIDEKDIVFFEKRKLISKSAKDDLTSNELIKVFFLKFDGTLEDMDFNKDEISELRLFGVSELRHLVKTKPEMFAGPETQNKDYFLETIDRIEKLL